jgi:hypothetical protein
MNARIRGMLISFSVLTASASLAGAQEAQPSQSTIVVGSGNDLRCRLEKGLRITKAGEPVTAKLVGPVYIGATLAIPEGSTIQGHVSSVSTDPSSNWIRRILRGDFTPPKTANVTFEQLVLSDGTSVPIHTDTTVAIGGIQAAQYLPKPQRPGIGGKIKGALKPIREPNKLQRLSQAAVTSLPYHPEYLSQGMIFDATLLDPITTPTPIQPAADVNRPHGDNYVRLRLLTPVSSQMIVRGAPIEAVVSQPYYNSDHVLVYPAGTKLEGTVNRATAAGWMKKGGGLQFSFHSAQTADGTTSDLRAAVAGVQAAAGQKLVVDEEGQIKTTTSLFTRLRAPISLIGPSRAVTDSTVYKTAWSRAGAGRNGFGLLGAGAAQASASAAIGFGYFGAAIKIYEAFFAKGSNVELPVNTPMLLLISDRPTGPAISRNQQ